LCYRVRADEHRLKTIDRTLISPVLLLTSAIK
jgi:hypothetical protein